jgi:hypothetical protein
MGDLHVPVGLLHKVNEFLDGYKGLSIKTSSFAYQAEILIKLLCAGTSFVEVPIRIDPPKGGRRSRAFRWKNMVEVGRTLADLFMEIRVRRRLQVAP